MEKLRFKLELTFIISKIAGMLSKNYALGGTNSHDKEETEKR